MKRFRHWKDANGAYIYQRFKKPINTAEVFIVSAFTFLWGLFVALPFNVFTQAPLYDSMNSVAPEIVWGAIAMVVGLGMIWGVVKPSITSLTRSAYLGAIYWGTIAGFYLTGDWQNTGWLVCIFISVYCSFVYLNVRVNRKNLPFENKADNINPE